ncbi:DUF2586 domain-containing protein [Pasteurella multocida]|uniref:DUF2586 domain-containing protein n=1 Tax=Pasteurella multocida TaxID=747 RepID=A0A9X3UQ04_PASMD|nr:DUF2586 domain-containing protein [Pasteurella multocida]MBF6980595.1 DUF2586 domain-containing protein [Pasteurella multocida]MDA5607499.1 DUF2586 domain-containing protein [Pasteurella multocida subsp. multocida]MDA5615121.1 DUF2586 domain-containing protein [Pasteurella multocida]MDA5620597.1 DUF2586 domain-containing protein [Pasteurella multocida subsp. multocida]MDA5623302.1 DUF2586 domain-containing protein [Pasteurella multocida]
MFPSVQINTLNLLSGEVKEIERHALFVGVTTQRETKLTSVTPDSDFDKVFGVGADEIKKQVRAAMLNAGQNWIAHVMLVPQDSYDFSAAVRKANEVASFEYAVNTHATGVDKAAINKLQELYIELLTKLGRRTFFVQAIAGVNPDSGDGETWAQYVQKLKTLQQTVVADHVMLVPLLFGNEVGVIAGRLANRTVTVADSPARVLTGALIDLGNAEKPKDKEGTSLDLSHLKTLEQARYSVPMWYPDYDGYYWADGRTLDVEGGDYQVIENVRVVDKVARRVRLLAIQKIADRSFNSTASSTEFHKNYFAKPMRDMSKSATVNGKEFPGECMPPKDDAVTIVWHSKTKVTIYIKVRPYDCPKEITVNIFLDLETLGD